VTDLDRKTLLNRTAKHEGLRLKPYTDTVGKLTVGFGRNLEDKGLSKKEAAYLLHNDLDDAERECRRAFAWFDSLDGPRQTVLIEMCLNLGLKRLLGFGQTLKAISEGRYDDAADQMLRSKWAQQVKGRAVTLAGIMRTGSHS
jgi:lysozyme